MVRTSDRNGGYSYSSLQHYIRQWHFFRIREKVKFNCSGDYETSETPGISYTNLQGHTLELTFFSPETAYSGQYKLNGNSVQLNTEYISQSKYMEQKANSNVLLFHTPEGTKTWKLE